MITVLLSSSSTSSGWSRTRNSNVRCQGFPINSHAWFLELRRLLLHAKIRNQYFSGSEFTRIDFNNNLDFGEFPFSSSSSRISQMIKYWCDTIESPIRKPQDKDNHVVLRRREQYQDPRRPDRTYCIFPSDHFCYYWSKFWLAPIIWDDSCGVGRVWFVVVVFSVLIFATIAPHLGNYSITRNILHKWMIYGRAIELVLGYDNHLDDDIYIYIYIYIY